MSGEIRMHSCVCRATLASTLRMIGIKVPDQSKIAHMMEATRIGLLPTVSRLRLSVAWYRWLKHLSSSYEVYSYDDFTKQFLNSEGKLDCLAHSWGGMPPELVQSDVELIKKRIPGVELFVHATFDDPWLEVRLESESAFIHCWMRPYGRSNDIKPVDF